MLESITYLISRCVDKIKGQLNNMVKRKHILSFKGILYMLQKYFRFLTVDGLLCVYSVIETFSEK